MAQKPRSDSLYAKLTPAQREDVLFMLLVEGQSLEAVGGHLHDLGIHTSAGALSNLLGRHGLTWRVQRATGTAAELKKLKLGNVTRAARQGLAKQIYEASFRDLSVREMMLLARADLDERKLEVKQKELALATDRFQWDAAGRVLKAAKEHPQLLRDLAGNTKLTDDQRVAQLVLALWGPPDAERRAEA